MTPPRECWPRRAAVWVMGGAWALVWTVGTAIERRWK